ERDAAVSATELASATRSIRTPTRPARGTPASPTTSPRRSLGSPRTAVWAGVPPQQLARTPMNFDLGLELANALTRGHQLDMIGRREAGLQALVDPLL